MIDMMKYIEICTKEYKHFNIPTDKLLHNVEIDKVNHSIIDMSIDYIDLAIIINTRKSYSYNILFENIINFKYEIKLKHYNNGIHIILSTYGYFPKVEDGRWLHLPVGILEYDKTTGYNYYTHLTPLPDKAENLILNRLLYNLYNYLDNKYGTKTIIKTNNEIQGELK